jgi:tetratricopeptide (TPR) repeat protein
LIQAVGGLKSGAALQTRVGIATGLVVVGDLIGSGEAQERGIVGETPNVAARLQGVAEPNTVVIAESTRRLLGGLFDLQNLGAQDLKGIGGPVGAWAVLRPASVESRFEALHASGLTELVGREEELELLLRRWSKAKTGEGQVVLLSGEAGVGKSRLTAALLEHLASVPYTRLRNFCSPQHTDSALYPTIGQIERAAGFTHADTLLAKLNKLDALLAQTSTSTPDAALIAEMLSLPNDGRYPTLELTPQQRRQKTLEALVLQVVTLSRQNPLLMILEDAHWIDPTSLELFGSIVDRIPSLRVLLIVTFRPEFEPPWIGRSYVATLMINRLAEREAGVMIDRVTGNKPLPASIKQDIIERTDGIPLFVEEMTKAVLEAQGEGAAERAIGVVPSPVLAVPASLHASLMARLDRLGRTAKELAQKGAAIGREFSYDLLASVADLPEPQLCEALDRLTDSGLLFVRGIAPQSSYTFKHALVQDAAYGTLLRNPRQQLHAGIATALEQRFPDIVTAQPELLAHHYMAAGLAEAAVRYLRRAGERSTERSANLEAITHLKQGLEVLKTLPESPQRDEQELMLQVALLAPHWASKGWASPGAECAATRAVELCRQIGADTPEQFWTLWALAAAYFVRGEIRVGRQLVEQCLQLAERLQDRDILGYGYFLMGDILFWFGELVPARVHLERGIALYDPERLRPTASQRGFDSCSACRSFLGRVLWHLGYPDQALMHSEQAIAIAEDASQPFGQCHALTGRPLLITSAGMSRRPERGRMRTWPSQRRR